MRRRQHKMAALSWVAVYPLITLLMAGLEPLLSGLFLPLRTLIMSAIMVPVMVYIAIPTLDGFFGDKPQRDGAQPSD